MLREACDGAAFRLIGIGGSDLCDDAQADRGDLADTEVRREAEREAAIDRLREKFGPAAVQTGLAFRSPRR
jgi:DNA polymerase-4